MPRATADGSRRWPGPPSQSARTASWWRPIPPPRWRGPTPTRPSTCTTWTAWSDTHGGPLRRLEHEDRTPDSQLHLAGRAGTPRYEPRRHRGDRRPGRLRLHLGDGPPVPDQGRRPARAGDAGGLPDARLPRGAHG